MGSYRMLFIWLFSVSYMRTSASLVDSLTTNQSIIDGETLVSADGTFEAGFFSPGSSKGRYLGVWYTRMSPIKVVWVANRETPLQNRSGVLKVNEKGILMLLDGKNSTAWSSNTSSSKIVNNPIVQLLDSGNLVVKNGQDIINEDKFLWQSFDYPCDTLLPGMKIGWNLVTGLNRFVSSWRSVDDPAVGEYSVKIDPRGYPQVVALKGSVITTRAGSWNGIAFTGYPIYKLKQMSSWEFVLNEEEVYFKYELLDGSIFSMQSLTPSGNPQSLVFNGKTRSQEVFPNNQGDQCETYATCGANAICHVGDNSPTCECLKGFVPTFPEEWNISFWSNGCVRKTKLDCNYRDGFRKYQNMKLPDTASSWYSKTIDLGECQNLCLKNCSCTSYANLDISNGGSGCLLWFDDLIDMREFSHRGQDLYIRVHASELGNLSFFFLVFFFIAAWKAMHAQVDFILQRNWKKRYEGHCDESF